MTDAAFLSKQDNPNANEDLDCLQRNPHVWINCDAISTVKRLDQRCPGRAIGVLILQVNTAEAKGSTKFIGVNGFMATSNQKILRQGKTN